GALAARGVRRARDHAPRLGNRVDAAFGIHDRAKRRAIAEVSAAVPIAVPCLLERLLKRARVFAPTISARMLTAFIGNRRKTQQRGMEEPAEPDAFAFAVLADLVHAVVPIACSDQRQAVRADCKGRIERERAVLKQARLPRADRGLKERILF